MSIQDNFKAIKEQIPAHVTILGASKKKSAEQINQAIEAGLHIIGENYVQEAEQKAPSLSKGVQVHLIGPLQKNKINKALALFDCIQTVDSLELAQEIDKRATKKIDILLQVNIGDESQKSGCDVEQVQAITREIAQLPHIVIKGLMCIPPMTEDTEQAREYFKKMKHLFDDLKNQNIPNTEIAILSMGMSHDYRIAIQEGSTMIRLGTVIFGKRE